MRNNKKNGFTIIELIVVISIIGILVAIATPRLQKYTTEAKVRKEIASAEAIHSAAAAYDAANKIYDKSKGSYNYTDSDFESILTPYVDSNAKMVADIDEVDEPGEFCVFRIPDPEDYSSGNKPAPIVRYVFYYDARVAALDMGYNAVIREGNNTPVVWVTLDFDQDPPKFITVDKWLETVANW